MRRILFLAERTALVGGHVPSHGSGAHVLASLRQLETRFAVEGVFAASGEAAPSALRKARRLVPQRVRGARQDILFALDDRSFAERALAVAESFRPDLVYERNEYFALAGTRIARKLGIPHVLEVNGLLDLEMRTFYRSLAEPLGAHLERRKLRTADTVVAVSTGLSRLLVDRGAGNVVVVPNSVVDDRILPRPRPVRDADDLVVGWVGHLMAWHSLETLVAAAPAVLAVAPRARFRIVGGGGGLDRLKGRVTELGMAHAFEFVGAVPFTDVGACVAEFDIGVIPAHFDYGFPVKVAEMGAAGIPVVAPRTRTMSEMLVPDVEYAPFEPRSVDDLAHVLHALLFDAAARARLGSALHAAVRERYSWSAVAPMLCDVVAATAESRTARD